MASLSPVIVREMVRLKAKKDSRNKKIQEKEANDYWTDARVLKRIQGQKAAAAFRRINEERRPLLNRLKHQDSTQLLMGLLNE